MFKNLRTFMLALTAVAVISAPGLSQEATELFNSVSPAVCSLESDSSRATGFYVADGKFLVTADHFVKSAKSINVSTPGVRIEGVLYSSPVDDIAILAVSGTPKHSLTLANGLPTVGQRVFAIGNSLGQLENSLSDGLVSGVRQRGSITLIQFTAPVSPGNSGGPIVNASGSVVGMVSSQLERGQNLNFAVSAATLSAVLENVSPANLRSLAELSASRTDLSDLKTKVLEDMESMLTRFAFVPGVDFSSWPDLVAGRKEAIESAQTPDQFVGVINLALREYGFSHIVLFSPQFAERRTTQRMVGLGVRVEIEEGGLRVVFTFPEGPAAQAGIISGDLIFEADGKPVRAAGDLAGEEGSELTVKVMRDGEEKSFEVERKAFSMVIPETLRWVDDDTAMVTIPTFDAGYNRRNVEALFESAMDAKRIIVDLRNNGGGQVNNLLHLSSFFLDTSEPLGTFISRQNYESFISEHERDPESILEVAAFTQSKVRPMRRDASPYEGDVAVLINRGSGSASEMFAAAMREYRDAPLIGAESAGAVLASIMRPIHGNFLLQFPVTDYVTIKGRRLEGNGLEPDIEAANPRFGAEDEGVLNAMRWFQDKE